MYLAKLTEQGAKRYGLPIDARIEYETIHALGKCIVDPVIDGKQTTRLMGFVYEDRSVDLITWPTDFDWQETL